MINVRIQDLKWHVLKYEDFMAEPQRRTTDLVEFLLETDFKDEEVMRKCLETTEEDSQGKEAFAKEKMGQARQKTSANWPQNSHLIVDEVFQKFGLPSIEKFDALFL